MSIAEDTRAHRVYSYNVQVSDTFVVDAAFERGALCSVQDAGAVMPFTISHLLFNWSTSNDDVLYERLFIW